MLVSLILPMGLCVAYLSAHRKRSSKVRIATVEHAEAVQHSCQHRLLNVAIASHSWMMRSWC
jgi:hypothetical protein